MTNVKIFVNLLLAPAAGLPPHGCLHPPPGWLESRAGQLRSMETLVQFRNRRGNWLRGMIHRPAGSRHAPAVVFFHGFTGDRLESHWIFVKCARALAREGVASLRFDFFGSGESEGEFRDATLLTEIADAEDAVAFLRRQKGIDAARMGLAGLSLGGCIAARIAPKVHARALVLWSAVAHPTLLRKLARATARPLPGSKGALEYDAREISPRFLAAAHRVKPVAALRRFRGPTLVIHPERDTAVPLSHADDLFRAAGADLKATVVIPGADHTFTSLAWEAQVIGRTVDWLRECL